MEIKAHGSGAMIGTGEYTSGRGKASANLEQYEAIFKSPMVGTFNVRTDIDLLGAKPAIRLEDKKHSFWLVRIGDRYGWAIRWDGSKMRPKTWEVLTRTPLPEEFKAGRLEVEILERWDPEAARKWAMEIGWFQSFSWGPTRADSEFIWKAVARAAGWDSFRGKTVLDIGCNAGYHAFRAAGEGAAVVGFDKNRNIIPVARTINDHIEMQDVRFVTEDPGGIFDFVFYLSVHHQFDPTYDGLEAKIRELQARARVAVFAEFICPPLKGTKTAEDLDRMAGGPALASYRHKVRGTRRIYKIGASTQTEPNA